MRIETRLDEVAGSLDARPERCSWSRHFYQLANRLAHLDFFRSNGVPTFLVLVNFVNAHDVGGPTTKEAWLAAYQVAFHTMGLKRSHPLARFVIDIFPNVEDIVSAA